MTFDLEYNSGRPLMIIPEYGRHIQKLVDHCVALETKEERDKMAKAIVDVMGNLQPHLRDVPDFKHKLWDQLYIMSEFKLDAEEAAAFLQIRNGLDDVYDNLIQSRVNFSKEKIEVDKSIGNPK